MQRKEDWLMMQLFCEVPIDQLKSWTATACIRDTKLWENFQCHTYLPYAVTLLNQAYCMHHEWYMARTCGFKNGHSKDTCCNEIGQ
jgi:hypothetical protein